MLEFVKGDIFDAPADIRVNTVNCVGVMGAGVALAFKKRYPEMFKDYQRDCKDGRVTPGTMHVWKSLTGDWIINFPTKRDWRDHSRYEDIDAGLDDLRGYLDDAGPVTIALPALGCGHGGLDWDRVSGMIRKKLDGLDAHVLVFEPAASRQAGRAATEQPTDDERASAEQLGYALIERESVAALDLPGPVYIQGKPETLSREWIALLPSRSPAGREMQALRAIAAELAQLGSGRTIALVYGSRTSEEVASLFLNEGVNVVMLLPFGVLTRKGLAKQPSRNGGGAVTLVSAAPANGKWNRQLFAQTMDILRQNAEAILLSDPEPDWLTSKGLSKWGHKPISFVRYETTPADMRDALSSVGAHPIGRRGQDGAPNIDFLLAKQDGVTTAKTDDPAHVTGTAEITSARSPRKGGSHDGDPLILVLDVESEVERQKLFDALVNSPSARIALEVTLPAGADGTELQRLLDLGFTPTSDG